MAKKKRRRTEEVEEPDASWPGEFATAPPTAFFERQLALLSQKVRIYTETRQKRHVVTIIEGLDPKVVNLKQVTSRLKALCAAGGTYKKVKDKYVILIQGDHVDKVKRFLTEELGIPEENIEVV